MIDTSSFFWLGLVGSVFFGLILTIFRARHSRAAPRGRTQDSVAIPQLWEACIDLDTRNGGDISWKTILPLSARVTRSVDVVLAKETSKKPRFNFHLRRPSSTKLAKRGDFVLLPGELSTIILLPCQRSLQEASTSKEGTKVSHTYNGDFALGTIPVPYRDIQDTS